MSLLLIEYFESHLYLPAVIAFTFRITLLDVKEVQSGRNWPVNGHPEHNHAAHPNKNVHRSGFTIMCFD